MVLGGGWSCWSNILFFEVDHSDPLLQPFLFCFSSPTSLDLPKLIGGGRFYKVTHLIMQHTSGPSAGKKGFRSRSLTVACRALGRLKGHDKKHK